MTIQLAKDQAAQKHGYTDFDEFMYLGVTGDAMDDINAIYETAMERYAEAKEKEFAIWISKAASSTMENGIWLDLKCNEMTTDELYEVYKTQS